MPRAVPTSDLRINGTRLGNLAGLTAGVHMTFDIPMARSRFSAADRDTQLRILARFAHKMTIAARDIYVPGTAEVHTPSSLRAVNEIQHRVLGQILALLTNSTQRRPDDVIMSIMLEHDEPQLREWAARAFEGEMQGAAL